MFKDKIAELLKNANMTDSEFAKSIGVSVYSLSYYLSGRITPRRNVIDAICRKYHVTPEWLMEENSTAADASADTVSLDEVPAVKKTPAAGKAPAARKMPGTEKTPVAEKTPAKAVKVKEKQKATRTGKKSLSAKASVKPAAKKRSSAARTHTRIIIQSRHGASISEDEILKKVNAAAGRAEQIYVKPGENKAYWVNGASSGSVTLWD